MQNLGVHVSRWGLDLHGIQSSGSVYWNLPPARLYEEALRRGAAVLAAEGPLVASTGHHTGRSPSDRFIVRGDTEAETIWWGEVNRPIRRSLFNALRDRVRAYLGGRDLFVFNGCAGGRRISLGHTRRMVRAAGGGELDGVATDTDPVFGLAVPRAVEGVPAELLTPRRTWSDRTASGQRAARLAEMFGDNFAQFANGVDAKVAAAGPVGQLVPAD